MEQATESFSIQARTAILLSAVLVPLMVGAPLALSLCDLDPADAIPGWVLGLAWVVCTGPLWILWLRFGRRRWRDAIVVSPIGLFPRNEANAPIPWTAIDRILLLEQSILSGAGRYVVPVEDKSLLIIGNAVPQYRSGRGPGEFGAIRRRKLDGEPTHLLVIVTEVRPLRSDRPGYLRLADSIARFHTLERFERKSHHGPWTLVEGGPEEDGSPTPSSPQHPQPPSK